MSEETITVSRDELARIEATNVMLQQWVVERDDRIAELEAERKRLLDWMGEAVTRVLGYSVVDVPQSRTEARDRP